IEHGIDEALQRDLSLVEGDVTTVSWREDEVSLFAVGTMLLRNRWRIIRWMLIGGALTAVLVFIKPAQFVASASFIPQGTDPTRSGLASIAGQLGLSLPTGGQNLSPDFYAQLLRSRMLLLQIARQTFTVAELGGQKRTFDQLFEIKGETRAEREERAVRVLRKIISSSAGKTTNVVELSVVTKWPSVSLAIASALVEAVGEFNVKTRQGQAAAERRFVEGRLSAARAELRAAEDRLQNFLQMNREFARSSELSFERERLQRDMMLQQQVFTSLTESVEEVRIREVRDTPVITIVEPPSAETIPKSQKPAFYILLGLFIGAFVGAVLTLISEALHRRRQQGDSEAEEFAGTLGEVKGQMLGGVRTLKERIGR
ncbi:MAG TPA: GNVR domain-containing protein, partial [Gemmatimonadaceae bacterium]|nr:GNVR domain-containing protein [Gemmatimonadaceae bacterium]